MCSNKENHHKIKVLTEISDDKLIKPFEHGWRREIIKTGLSKGPRVNKTEVEVCYISPTGKKIRNKKELVEHLDNDLHIDMFSFSKRHLGFDGETVRQASAKGYPKHFLEPVHSSVLQSESSTAPVLIETTNDIKVDENLGKAPNNDKHNFDQCRKAVFVNKDSARTNLLQTDSANIDKKYRNIRTYGKSFKPQKDSNKPVRMADEQLHESVLGNRYSEQSGGNNGEKIGNLPACGDPFTHLNIYSNSSQRDINVDFQPMAFSYVE